MNKKRQTGLWIPIDILSSELSLLEKVILSDIISLSSGSNQFFKTNQVLADTFNVSLRTINTSIKSLIDRGLIRSEITYPYGNVNKKRIITLT
jgi:Mn-dependent DtxR family transcriptional regulator